MSLKRIEGWEGRLADFVAQATPRPFQWGTWDCCLMPCDAAMLVAGVDPAAPFRGKYSTELGARRALKRFAGGGLAATLDKIFRDLGAPEVPVSFARRGDLGIITDPEVLTGGLDAMMALCLGRDVGVMTEEGLRFLPLSRVARAWAIG